MRKHKCKLCSQPVKHRVLGVCDHCLNKLNTARSMVDCGCHGTGWIIFPINKSTAEIQRCDYHEDYPDDLAAASAFFAKAVSMHKGKRYYLKRILITTNEQATARGA